ncbi:hypothetical protein BV20DRAFT_982998 [Pilatotrama ljubarskyi]|nr:hypothetical protein BV20DRAFT_982998 [Pilatotrama ljubarskyi]
MSSYSASVLCVQNNASAMYLLIAYYATAPSSDANNTKTRRSGTGCADLYVKDMWIAAPGQTRVGCSSPGDMCLFFVESPTSAQPSPPPAWHPEDSQAFSLTALQIRAMRDMHEGRILHGDVHPGNIGLTRAQWSMAITLGRWMTTSGPFSITPTLQTGFFEGRVSPYTAADNLVSLSYVILALRMMSHPPWCKEAAALPAINDQDYRESMITVQARWLADIRRQELVEREFCNLIEYAENIRPNAESDYETWLTVFSQLSASSQVALGRLRPVL